MTVRYEVVADVEPALAEQYQRYMQDKHIPEIWTTGCFAMIVLSHTSPTTFRTAYIADTQADLDRYLTDHTAHYRADFSEHFPQGVALSRIVWTDVQKWE